MDNIIDVLKRQWQELEHEVLILRKSNQEKEKQIEQLKRLLKEKQ
jgi:hypothetical protein